MRGIPNIVICVLQFLFYFVSKSFNFLVEVIEINIKFVISIVKKSFQCYFLYVLLCFSFLEFFFQSWLYERNFCVSFQKWIIFHKPTTNLFFAWLFARLFQSYISQVLKNIEFILWHMQFIVYARFI